MVPVRCRARGLNNAALAAGLLLAAFALALGFARRRMVAAVGLVCAGVTIATALAVSPVPREYSFIGCWASLAAVAATVYWPQLLRDRPWLWLVLATNCGAWAGLVLAVDALTGWALQQSLSALFLAIPASMCVDRGWAIVPRVVMGWLLAVALLAGAMSQIVEHPGYLPDHRE